MKKLKALINKMIDIPKLIITIWLLLWVILFMLVVFKFCFNIWYPIVVENEKFIAVCNFIDNNIILRYIILFTLYLINFNIYYLTCRKSIKYKNIKHLVLINLLISISYVLKYFSNLLGSLLEIIVLILFNVYYHIKNKTFKGKIKILNFSLPLIIYVILNLWQSNILFVRGLKEILSNLPMLIVIALQLDYYIFTLITWIGVYYIMGLAGVGWWWSNQLTKYEAYKEKELKKANPDMDYVNYCDSKINECKEKLNEIKNKDSK